MTYHLEGTTRYRISQDGYGHQWLEYYKKTFFGGKWIAVKEPYIDERKIHGRSLIDSIPNYYYKGYVTSNFNDFVKKYPHIEEYLKHVYEPEQLKLDHEIELEKKRREKESSKKIYFYNEGRKREERNE